MTSFCEVKQESSWKDLLLCYEYMVCVCLHVRGRICMGVQACVCVHVWQAEIDIGCLPQSFSTLTH